MQNQIRNSGNPVVDPKILRSARRLIAGAVAVFHMCTFSVPHAWAPIVDQNGNPVTSGDGADIYGTLQDGGVYTAIGMDLGTDQKLALSVLNQEGLVDPNARAVVNVADDHATVWEGLLDLVGTVAFYNPMGFVTTETFQANVSGGALLTTLAINPTEFFSAMAELSRDPSMNPAMILNQGTWNVDPGSWVAMVGSAVRNEGRIFADGGAAVLAAGDQVTMDISGGNGLISVEVTQPVEAAVFDFAGNKVADQISNTGTIQANGGLAVLTAKGSEEIFDNIINHTGIIEANTIAEVNGQIVLDGGDDGVVRVDGVLRAKGDDAGEKGGKIKTLGEKVGLFDNAEVDVSGYAGGGEVLIGGDYQGQGEIPTADAVYISKWATINADAILEGDGGRVIVWGNDVANVHGTITARGGILGGNGGFIETSSLGTLDTSGIIVDASATSPNGQHGKWLIDPYDIEVIAGSGTTNGTWAGGVFTSTGNTATIGVDTITGALNGGTNVTVQTINNPGNSDNQNGDITIKAAIGMSTAGATVATLTFTARNNIIMQAATGISAAGAAVLNLVMSARNNITLSSSVTTQGGTFTADADSDGSGSGNFSINDAAVSVATGDGALSVTANDITLTGTLNAGTGAATLLVSDGGTIRLGNGSGNMTISGSELQNITANSLTIGDNTNDDITVDGISATHSANVGKVILNATDSGSGISFSNNASTFQELEANAGGGITVSRDVTTTAGGIKINADFDDNGGGTFEVADTRTVDSGNQDLQITAANLDLNNTGAIDSGSGDTTIVASDGRDIRLGSGSDDMTISGSELQRITAQDLTIGDATINDISVRGITATHSANISGTITLNALANNGDVLFEDSASTFRTLTVNADRNITVEEDLTVTTGALTFDAGNDIDLDNDLITDTAGMSLSADNTIHVNDDIDSAGKVLLHADADGTNAGDVNIGSSDEINTNNNDLEIIAHNFAIDTGSGTISAGSGTVMLKTSVANTTIGLGGGTGTFNVTDAEADRITASSLEIGAADAGNIKVNDFSPANTNKLILRTGGSVTEGSADGTADVTVADLGIQSVTGVNIDVDVANLGIENSGAGGINVKDTAGGMTVNSLANSGASIDGVTSGSGDVDLETVGAGLTLSDDVSTADDVSLTSGAGINQTAGAISADDLSFSANGAVTLDQAANKFNTLDGTTTSGAVSVADSDSNTEIINLKTVGSTVDYDHTGTGDVTISGTVSSGTPNPGGTDGGNITISSSNGLTNDGTITSMSDNGGTGTFTGAGFTNNGSIVVGKGDITLNGGAAVLDTILNTPIISGINIVITALRDILVQSSITTNTSADISMTADTDLDGSGGVWVQSGGPINSDGDVTLIGSDVFATAGVLDSVVIDDTVTAAGDITIQHSSAAPAGADILINNTVTSNAVGGTIAVDSVGAITSTDDGTADLLADNVALDAVNGIDVELDADTTAFNNTTAGDVEIEDMAGGLTVGSAGGLTGGTNNGGSTSILTHSPLTIAADMIQAGAISLTAGETAGAGDDLTVNAGVTVQSTAGNVDLKAGDDVNLLGGSTVQSDTGTVDITAGSGDLDSLGSIAVSGLVSAFTTATLSAAVGAITDGNGASNNIDAATLNASSATGIDLDTDVNDMTATTSGAGNIDIDEADGVTLTNVAATTGDVTVDSGNMLVGNVSASGTVTLGSSGTIDSVTDDGVADVSGATVSLVAALGGIGLGSVLDVAASTALNADTTADNSSIALDSIGDAKVGLLDAGSGDVTLDSTGTIEDANGVGNNVKANVLTADAATSIDLDTDVNSIDAETVSGVGDITFDELDGVTLTDLETFDGSITVNAGGTIDATSVVSHDVPVTSADITLTTTSGDINVTSINADGDATLTANTGAILGVTDDGTADVIGRTVSLTAGSGGIRGAAVGQALDVAASTALNADTTADNSSIALDSIGSALIGLVNAGSGDVTLNSTGAIDSVTYDGVADVSGATLNLTALAGGIGQSNVLEVTASTILNADTTADNSSISIDSIGALPLGLVDAGSGDVTLSVATANDAMTDANDIVPDAPGVNNVKGGNILLNTNGGDIGIPTNKVEIDPSISWGASTGGGDLNIACVGDCPLGVVDVGTATFRFSSGGSITDSNDAVSGEDNGGLVNITAGGLVLEAGNGIGVLGNAIETRLSDYNGVAGTDGLAELDGGTGGVYLYNKGMTGAGLTMGGIGDLVNGVSSQGGSEIYSGSPLTVNSDIVDTLGGDISLTASGATPADILTLNAKVQTTGDVYFTAGGAINQTGGTVTANDLVANAGGDMTLDLVGNDADKLVANVTGDTVYRDTDDLDLGASTFGGTLTLTTGGNLTDSGALVVNGWTDLTAGSTNDIVLDDSNDFQGAVSILSGKDVTLHDVDDLELGASTVTGILDVTAGATIFDGGNVTADQLAFNAGSSVTLDESGNDFNTVAGTSNGTMTLVDADDLTVGSVGAETGLISNNSDIDVTAGGNVTLAQQVNAGAGNVDLDSTGGAIDSTGADSVADIVGKKIDLQAAVGGIGNTGVVEVTASQQIDADTAAGDNSNIQLVSIGDAPVGVINAGAGDVDLTSTGNMTDALNNAAANVLGGTITLLALVGGIGALGNALDFTATTAFNADTTVASGGDDGDIIVRSVGDAPIDLIDAGTGDVSLTSSGNISDYRNDSSANIKGATIDLETEGADDIGALANYFDIEPSTLWNVTMNGGNPYINCIGACPVGQVDIGTGTFYYAGTLTDGNDVLNGEYNGATWNIRAGGAHLEGVAGIGTSSNWIEMRLADYGGAAGTDGLLMADGGTGGVFVSNLGTTGAGLTIGGIAPATLTNGIESAGGISVMSGSPLTVAADVIDNAGNDVTLAALGSAGTDDLTVNSGIEVRATGGNGDILLVAGDDITLQSNAIVRAAGTGQVTAAAGEDYTDATLNQDGNGGGSVVMNSGSAFRSQDGDILLDAANNVRLTSVNADSNGDGTRGDVTIRARSGYVSDRNGSTVNITGDYLTIESTLGVGDDSVADGNILETNVTTLEVTNTTSGGVRIDEVSAGGALNIQKADQQGAGNLRIRTENGHLRVLAAGSGVSATSGAILLAAQGGGSNDDLVVNNTVTSTTGKINLDSTSRDVTFSAAGDVTSTSGEIEVDGQRHVTMADGTVLNAGSGVIDIDAQTGDVTLGSVQTTSALATSSGSLEDAVQINANSGAVIDGGDTDTDILANSGQTTIQAADGVGDGNALEVQLDRLDVTNTATNNIEIDEEAAGTDLNIVRADQQGPGDLILRTLDGTMTVLAALAGGMGVSATTGETFLIAQGAGSNDDLVVNNTVTSTTGKINLDSTSRDVTFSAAGDVTSTSGEIEVDGQRHVTMADGTVLNAGSGVIDIDAQTGDVTLGSVQTTSALATSSGSLEDAVQINANSGAVIDGGDTDTDILANSGQTTIQAANGVGNGNALEVQLDRLDVTNTATNNIEIDEEAAGTDLNIVRADQQGPGDLILRTLDGTMTVLAALAGGLGVSATSGATTLRAEDVGANDDLLVNNTVTSTTGKINLDAGDDVIFSADGDVTSTSGEIEVEANNGAVTMADGTLLDAGSGKIDIDAEGDVTLGGVKTSDATDTAVVIVSRNGEIIDGGDTHMDIETGALTGGMILSAKNGIGDGVGNDLDTQGGKLSAFTQEGDIRVYNTGQLTIDTLTDDNDPTNYFGQTGAGTVTGVQIVDPSIDFSTIFVRSASPMIINSPVLNFDGGNVSLYALGSLPTDTMSINANVRTENGNGDVRLVSGGSMTQALGVTVSSAGDGVTSGTGNVYVGAGYDATGKLANEPVTPGLDITLASATLLDTVGDATADFTMTEGSFISTEDGDVLVDVQDTFTVGRVDADGNAGADITDGVRGDITTFSRNGSTLDAETPDIGNLDFLANTLTMFSGGTIGEFTNHIEVDAPFVNTSSAGSQFIDGIGNTQINLFSQAGDINFTTTGNILLGYSQSPLGQNSLTAGGSILSQGGPAVRVLADNVIRLTAGGIVGTSSEPIHTQMNHPGTLFLGAGGSRGGLSGSVTGNFSGASVQFLNTPPGLVFFNNAVVIGGAILPLLTSALATLFYSPLPRHDRLNGQIDGPFAADFPGFFNQDQFSGVIPVGVDVGALDVIPIDGLELLPPVVPIPEEEEKKPEELPAPAVEQPVLPAVQQQPPAPEEEEVIPPPVVPIPEDAVPAAPVGADDLTR